LEREAVVSLFHWLNIPNAKVYAIDVSEKALATAKKCNKPSGCYLY
jgi:methylase of polypeptide subunit release factors